MSSADFKATSGRVKVRDGTSIAYRLWGADQPPEVALVHSLAMDGRFWEPVAQSLAGRVTVLAIDARGHGASDKPAGPYTVPTFADDLADVLKSLGAKKVVVAGASMGGCVALGFAAAYPEMTAAVGLYDTTAWYGETAPKDWATRADNALTKGLPALIDFQATRWFSDAFRAEHPEVLKRCVDIFLENDPKAFAATAHMLGNFDGRSMMAGIKVPTAVLVGEEDYAAPPAMAEALHKGIAGSTYAVIPQARHLTPLETPDVVTASINSLLDRAAA
jgi:3-oxoadipate enol-lactonase